MSKYKKMKQLIADMRLPEYRYKQLLDAVFLQGIMRFEDMKLLPKTLREKLVEHEVASKNAARKVGGAVW